MILFWIIAGVLTLAAAVVLAAPLFDTRKFKSEDAFALEVYRDQLAELTRDEQRGLLTPEQARRGADRDRAAHPGARRGQEVPAGAPAQPSPDARDGGDPAARRVSASICMLGSPHLPSQSAMERLAEERKRTSPEVQALEAKVEQSPSDAQSWIDLGRAYADIERAKDAADAFAKAMALGRNRAGPAAPVCARRDLAEGDA